jgi:hypothetical protein
MTPDDTASCNLVLYAGFGPRDAMARAGIAGKDMKTSTIVFLCLPLIGCASSSSSGTGSGAGGTSGSSSGSASGAGGGAPVSGASTGASMTGATTGTATGSGTTIASGTTSGSASGSGTSTGGGSGLSSGSASGAGSGSATGSGNGASTGGVDVDAGLPPGAVNMVPATYMGKPFTSPNANVIPGFVYVANYDTGGAGVAFCHSTTGAMTAQGCMGGDLNDWCCGNIKGCNEANQPMTSATYCPQYRPLAGDNAGLSHMNMGEPDCYASTGPTWQFLPGSNGPTLDGPMVTAGTPVPQDAHDTQVYDAYLSYTYTGEWLKFTVEVLAGGMYSIGALLGVPGGTELTIDFGSPTTSTVMFTPTASPCMWRDEAGQGCPETYHSWENLQNLAMVTIPAPGTYVMTFTIVTGTINPLYFTFTKM